MQAPEGGVSPATWDGSAYGVQTTRKFFKNEIVICGLNATCPIAAWPHMCTANGWAPSDFGFTIPKHNHGVVMYDPKMPNMTSSMLGSVARVEGEVQQPFYNFNILYERPPPNKTPPWLLTLRDRLSEYNLHRVSKAVLVDTLNPQVLQQPVFSASRDIECGEWLTSRRVLPMTWWSPQSEPETVPISPEVKIFLDVHPVTELLAFEDISDLWPDTM